MGVPSLNDLAVDGTLNTTNQPTNQPSLREALLMFCFIKAIKKKLQISWTAFPLQQRYIESWAMVMSASSRLDEWLVIKRGFHKFTWARMIFKPGFYILNRPFRFSILWDIYLTAPGRCPLAIDEVKSQGAPQRTARTLTGCTLHSCRARLINRCIVR